jgi:hypothetical protein
VNGKEQTDEAGDRSCVEKNSAPHLFFCEFCSTHIVYLYFLSLSLSLSLSHNACTAESTDLSFSNPGSFCSFCVTSYNPLVSTKTEPFLNLLSNSNDPAKEFCDHAHNCNSAFVLPYVLNLKPSASFQNFGIKQVQLVKMTVGICNKEIVMKLLRESPAVLRMSSCCRVKLDEEKSKHAGLAQHN